MSVHRTSWSGLARDGPIDSCVSQLDPQGIALLGGVWPCGLFGVGVASLDEVCPCGGGL